MFTLLLPAIVLSSAQAADAVQLHPTLQVRPRVEAHTGRDGLPDGEAIFVSQRTRLGAELKAPQLRARLSFQDVRLWGSESHTLLDYTADSIDLHEGWLQWAPVEELSLRAGRQEINIHEQRLLGAVDWTPQGRSFDALSLSLSSGKLGADAGVAVLADADSAAWDTGGLMAFLRAGATPAEGAQTDLLVILDTDELSERTRVTGGLYAKAGSGALSGRVEAYGQVGSRADVDIQAAMVGVRGTFAPDRAGKPELTLWYDLLSGDGDAADTKATAFDTLFATNHKFYGQLDLVTFGLGGAVDNQGLHDAALKLGASPAKGLRANLDLHAFLAAAPAADDPMLGQEVDLWMSGKVAEHLQIAGGGAAFVQLTGDREPDLWAWLQLNLDL